jgi:hypothetical protein
MKTYKEFESRNQNLGNNNSTTTQFALIDIMCMLLLILLTLITTTTNSQQLNYSIYRGNTYHGSINITKSEHEKKSKYALNASASVKLFASYTIDDNLDATYTNGNLQKAHAVRYYNGKVKLDSETKYNKNQYSIKNLDGHSVLHLDSITWSTIMLYYLEPIGVSMIFSEAYQTFFPLEALSNNRYVLHLPNGNSTTYLYKNGLCTEVKSISSLFTLTFKLESIQGLTSPSSSIY